MKKDQQIGKTERYISSILLKLKRFVWKEIWVIIQSVEITTVGQNIP